MAQNEDMKCLLRDGKIVGHERRRIINENVMIIEHSTNMKIWCEVAPYMVDHYQDWIKHDSWGQGIKVGNEWWFEGDRGWYGGGAEFEVQYENGFFITDWSGRVIEEPIVEILSGAKRIGSIHDEPDKEGK